MKKILALLFLCLATTAFAETPIFDELCPIFDELCEDPADPSPSTNICSWSRYRLNFGMEKIFIRFPCSPTVTQANNLLTSYTYDHNILYSFCGYFPPQGNINPHALYEKILLDVSSPPFTILGTSIYQVCNGDWVLDYVVHDVALDKIIKSRTVVTPFNSYTLQNIFPNGCRDRFDYFADSFRIRCECRD